ncbi:HNH endonuclease signature motif containing protein [Paeniglutamicibacter sp. ORCA_105]|uniref:HNH endonuclease signature motif containing protein n=1 Tax=Paeniglutamicibacter sp. ORCA_105 TaxID=3377336 RepID=UPI00389632A2
MDTDRFIALATGTRGNPGHSLAPVDELRALLEAQRIIRDLSRRVAASTTSPTAAVLFAHAAEDGHRAAAHAQLMAADTARRTLAHELPEATFDAIAAIHRDPAAYTDGTLELPADPATVPTGRLVFRDTAELLAGTLNVGYFQARERVNTIDLLLPGTDIHGIEQPPRFPLLAEDFANGTADPKEIGAAARRLEKLTPQINQHPDPAVLSAQLEAQVAESVRREEPRTTAKLLAGIQTTLEHGIKDVPAEILRTKVGLFYRGTTSGIGEFLLRTLPADTATLLALCAQTDNPRTKAGDRDGLLQQALATETALGAAPATAEDAIGHGGASSESTDQSTNGRAGAGASFPDFLVDAATGQPLTDQAIVNSLSLDSLDINPNNLFSGNTDGATRTNGNGMGAGDPVTMNSTSLGTDGLTPPQRHLQGLMNLIKAAGKPSNGKKTTGLPSPKTLIIATLAEFQGLADTHGLTHTGQQLSPAELRQALCNGGAIPAVMGGDSQILDLGQEQRFFPDYMREIILGIYGGCIVPGCTVPPEHCEIHHFQPFAMGGKTEVNSGAPGCTSAHHGFHTGLMTVVRDTDGLFSVILPKFMDPEQKPRRNNYWRSNSPTPPLF